MNRGPRSWSVWHQQSFVVLCLQFNEEEEGYLKTMKGIEDKVNNTDKKLQEVHVQVSDIQKVSIKAHQFRVEIFV